MRNLFNLRVGVLSVLGLVFCLSGNAQANQIDDPLKNYFTSTRPLPDGRQVRNELIDRNPNASRSQVPHGAIVLQELLPELNVRDGMETRTVSCQDVFGSSSAEITYSTNPITEVKVPAGVGITEMVWVRKSGECQIKKIISSRVTCSVYGLIKFTEIDYAVHNEGGRRVTTLRETKTEEDPSVCGPHIDDVR